MNKRYKQLRKTQTTNSPIDWKLYKDLRNEVHRKLKKAESMYYLEALESTRNGCTDFWNLFKKMNKKETITKKTGPIKNEVGTLIFDDTEKANTLNQFFSTTGRNLVSNQEENANPSFYIHRVTPVIGDVDFPVEVGDIYTVRFYWRKILHTHTHTHTHTPTPTHPHPHTHTHIYIYITDCKILHR